ncbi:MAG: hypothetical protein B0D86_03955 [Candidatus Sedimenticola endophacoides]|nr:MAG: hypothetical protein B0D86_03955 [Candidatus Sedimenticola endophacoides]
MTEQIVRLATAEFWIFTALALAAAVGGFWFAFRNLARARLIEDTPTARIRSAQQGYVELNGEARDGADGPLAAPLTGIDCCWFRYKIEKRHDKGWRSIETKSSSQPFLLDDGSGECLIHPEGAGITPGDKSVWFGSTPFPADRAPARRRVTRQPLFRIARVLNTDIGFGNRYRYTEERIFAGDPIYAIGLFSSLDEVDHRQNTETLTRELLQAWKQNKHRLLERFDQDRDGRIDLQEWETARRRAKSEAGARYRERISGRSPHSLGRTGSRRHPFLISTLPEFDLVRRYRLLAALALAAFFAGGATATLLLSARF